MINSIIKMTGISTMSVTETNPQGATQNPTAPSSYKEVSAKLSSGSQGLSSLDADQSLGVVRDILFGEQVAELKRQHDQLDNDLRDAVRTLNDTIQQRFNALSGEIRQVQERLTREVSQRENNAAMLQGRLDKHDTALTQLGDKVQESERELAGLIGEESEQLTGRIQELRHSLMQQIQQTANELRYEKADRKAMASILSGMARELFDEESPADKQP